MNSSNLNNDQMDMIKNMVNNGNISDAISQISPEMISNFSKMLNQNQKVNTNNQQNNSSQSDSTQTNSTSNNFDFSNIDMNTIMKITSTLNKMNDKNDPRANLLYSLKPYLRDSKKEKLDQYVNLLNVTKIADILKDDKKENKNE